MRYFFVDSLYNTVNAYTGKTWPNNMSHLRVNKGFSVSEISQLISDLSLVTWVAVEGALVFNFGDENSSMADTSQGGIWGDFSSGSSPSTLATD
jgi:hypothetical protein